MGFGVLGFGQFACLMMEGKMKNKIEHFEVTAVHGRS
jgi:hypothetical protein